MTHQTVKAFVLREITIGESDRLVDLLSREAGLITAVAKGARRQKSPLQSSTQVFTLAEFDLFNYRSRYTIDSASVIDSFMGLRDDLDRLICAAHLSEVFLDALRDDVSTEELYQLWAYSAYELSRNPDPLLVVHAAQLRLLGMIGLAPYLESCQHCHAELQFPARFSFSSCGLRCSRLSCRVETDQSINLSQSAVSCLRFILQSSLRRLFHFALNPDVRTEVIWFSEHYVQHQMEKEYTRLNLMKGLTASEPTGPDLT